MSTAEKGLGRTVSLEHEDKFNGEIEHADTAAKVIGDERVELTEEDVSHDGVTGGC